MASHNLVSQLADYRGVFGWNSPATEIELYIKDHPIPVRRIKPTEVNSASQIDGISLMETGFKGVFYGATDLLQIQISGWIITPLYPAGHANYRQYNTSFGNVSYGEVIGNFLSGEYTATAGGAYQRKDPDYYITPYGHRYNNPIIALWDCQYTTNQAKQTFSATVYLES